MFRAACGPTSVCSAVGCGFGAGPPLAAAGALCTRLRGVIGTTPVAPLCQLSGGLWSLLAQLPRSRHLSLFTIHALGTQVIRPLGIKLPGMAVLVVPDIRGLHACPGPPSWVPCSQPSTPSRRGHSFLQSSALLIVSMLCFLSRHL